MKQKAIGFRELLEGVLPLDQLPPADRLMVQRALQSGVAGRLQSAALLAMDRLEQLGALHRLPPTLDGGREILRFQPRGGFEIIRMEVPAPTERDGVIAIPRASLPGRVPAALDQVRRLLHLEDAHLFSNPGGHRARQVLADQLLHASRDLLGATDVRFFPATTENGVEPPVSEELAAEARTRIDHVFYCPDATASRLVGAALQRRRLRALVVAGVTTMDGEAVGHLEVRSTAGAPFDRDGLARVVLLADYCGGVLERASRIEKLVFVDALTGVYNRPYFEQQAQNEMARSGRDNASMALCIADIDDFKAFNTTYGYEAGNRVLIHVAQSLRHAVRPFDTVARWGGEEFAVLLSSPVLAEDVLTVSDRLRTTVQRAALTLEGLDGRAHDVAVTVSIGVALFPEHAHTVPDLWRVANQALLLAKRPPKNQVVFYRP